MSSGRRSSLSEKVGGSSLDADSITQADGMTHYTEVEAKNDGKAETAEKVVLLSGDGKEFEIEVSLAMQSEMIKNVVEDGFAGRIPLSNVSGEVLAKVLEYWRRHAADHAAGAIEAEEIKKFDEEFVKVDGVMLVHLSNAANYLDCKPLLSTICRAIADLIKDHSVEDAREFLGIECDFTPEEELKIREQNAWAFNP